MNKKIAIGTFLALALVAGATNVTSAQAFGASAKADVRVEGMENHGLRGAVQSFFARHKDDGKRDEPRDANKGKDGDHEDRQDQKLEGRMGLTFGIGIVTAIDGDTITATSKKDADVTWTITTDSDTTFAYRGNETLEVGDRIAVAGTVTDNEGDARAIDATYVLAADANLAGATGTITGVDSDANTVTISTKHQGDVTIAVTSSTEIAAKDGDGAFSDLVVGAKIRVQGIWNSLRDLITAAKIRIGGHA